MKNSWVYPLLLVAISVHFFRCIQSFFRYFFRAIDLLYFKYYNKSTIKELLEEYFLIRADMTNFDFLRYIKSAEEKISIIQKGFRTAMETEEIYNIKWWVHINAIMWMQEHSFTRSPANWLTQSDFHNQNLIMWTVNSKLNSDQNYKLRSLIH